MMDLSESGLLEMAQIGVLAGASIAFLTTALITRRPGAPAFAFFSLALGVAALREYGPDAAEGWRAYLDSHAARRHLAAVFMAPFVFVTLRDRAFGLSAHARAVAFMAPVILVGIGLVWLAAAIEEWGGAVPLTGSQLMRLLLVEEALELFAYCLTAAAGLWALRRARQDVSPSWSPVTVLPASRRRGARLFGRV
ncbi:MAG: hypothetical protein ACK4JY_10315 [Brevundimonas sp.]|uniref:hypothetical protein n=1 Tax=Brevundimonas sp. TaxID=1871086 RepID=UPI003918A4A4